MSFARVWVGCRWDAVALLALLPHHRAYLVQTGHRCWRLHLERDRDRRRLASELVACVRAWLAARSLPEVMIEIEGKTARIRADRPDRPDGDLAETLLSPPRPEPRTPAAGEMLPLVLEQRLNRLARPGPVVQEDR